MKSTISLAIAVTGCGVAPTIQRQYVWEASELNVVPEAWPTAEPQRSAAPEPEQPAVRAAPRLEPVKPQRPTIVQAPAATESVDRPKPAPVSETSKVTQPAAPASTPPPQNTGDVRAAQRVEAALALLGTPGLQDRAFVAQVLRAAGQDIAVDTKVPYAAALWAKLDDSKVGKNAAKAGDLVFFHDTADINANGRPDDGVTLVGVVERAHNSMVLFIAQRAGKVRRMAVDPERPLVIRDSVGDVVNTRLVRWPGSAEPWTTGQCLTGYARLK